MTRVRNALHVQISVKASMDALALEERGAVLRRWARVLGLPRRSIGVGEVGGEMAGEVGGVVGDEGRVDLTREGGL